MNKFQRWVDIQTLIQKQLERAVAGFRCLSRHH